MKPLTFSSTDLPLLQDQIESWRRRQPGRGRLPRKLWDAAAQLARSHGVSSVARALRVGFYSLRRRVGELPPAGPVKPAPNPFIELKLDPPHPAGSPTAWVELIDGADRRMRIHTGHDPATWVALAHCFWGNRQ